MLELLPGIIWSVALGLAAGNYACSIIHRLPRNAYLFVNPETMTVRKPYCGSCDQELATRDLFPVVSWLMNRGKCRFCSAPIPASHLVTELLCAALFAACYLRYSFTEWYILVAGMGVGFIIVSTIQLQHGYRAGRILLAVFILAVCYRVLRDHTIYGFVQGGMLGSAIGLILWRVRLKRGGPQSIPDAVWFLGLAGVILGAPSAISLAFLLALSVPLMLRPPTGARAEGTLTSAASLMLMLFLFAAG